MGFYLPRVVLFYVFRPNIEFFLNPALSKGFNCLLVIVVAHVLK